MSFLAKDYSIIPESYEGLESNFFIELIKEYDLKITEYEYDGKVFPENMYNDRYNDQYTNFRQLIPFFRKDTFWETFRFLYESLIKIENNKDLLEIRHQQVENITREFYDKLITLLRNKIINPLREKLKDSNHSFVKYCLEKNRLSWVYLENYHRKYFDAIILDVF